MTVRIPVSAPASVHARTAAATNAAVCRVLASGRWVGGAVVQEAESVIAGLMGMAHGVGTGSGTSALQLALQALGIGPGDEVLVPAVSFVSTATAVLRTGARPVVVDVQEGMPLIDPKAVVAALGPRVKAVVTVSLFGNAPPPLEVPPGVWVVEDAAQAVGSTPVPRGAVARTASFYPTKVLAAAGDGGMVVTDRPELAARIRSLGHHGRATDGRFHPVAGHTPGNDRLDALQAAVLLARMPDLAPRVAHRRALLGRYRALLPELVLPHDVGSNVAVVAAVHPERDRLRAHLAGHGIETACYYPRPLAAEPVLSGACRGTAVPRAHLFCSQCFALPCHVELQPADVDRICAVLREQL